MVDPTQISDMLEISPQLPTPGGTDILNNPNLLRTGVITDTAQEPQGQIPETGQGAATLRDPNAPVFGGATIGQMLAAKGQAIPMPSAPSVHATKIGDNVAKALTPEAAQTTGGWARALVGGALDALKGVGTALGDVAAVGQVPSGAGGLTGVARTLAARNQRERQGRLDIQEADKNKIMMAEANTRMLNEQRLIHKMGREEIQASVDSGVQTVNKLKTAPAPAPVIAEGLTSDELMQYLKDNKIDPAKETAYPTGQKVVGTNKDGTPMYRTTYTALGVPPEVRLDPENEADKKILDDMNRYAPPSQGKWGSTGAQTMTGQQYNWVMQQAADNKAATMARDKTLIDQKFMERDNVRKLEAVTFGGTDWVNALAQAPGHDPIAARNAILGNPELRAKYPNLDSDLRYLYGEDSKGNANYDKMLENYQKKIDVGIDQITDLKKKVSTAHGEEAAGIAASIDQRLKDNPDMDPVIKAQFIAMRDQANSAAQASMTYDIIKKQKEAQAEQEAAAGDLETVEEMALNYQIDPDKLFSRFRGLASKQKFLAEMHRKDPTWSEAEYKARYKTATDFAPGGKQGLMVQSFNTFAGHLGEANNLIYTLYNTKSPLLNKGINKAKIQLGNDKVQPYIVALAAARAEYLNFLNNMHAKTKSDEELADKMIDENTSPGAAYQIMKQMAQTVAIRARSLNDNYKATMKRDYTDMMNPETSQILHSMGINTLRMGGVSGMTQEQHQQSQPQQLPPQAIQQLKEGQNTTFANGQTWTLSSGKPVQVQTEGGQK